MWDFSTDPEFQAKLDWMDQFVREEVEPLDHLTNQDELLMYRPVEGKIAEIVRPLQEKVKAQGLWACHLGPELGGQGFGQVKLALINEILGRTGWGPIIFGVQAPDTGNAEIIAMFGTEEQKQRYLQPLLTGEMFSAFSMTEPHGGADPRLFRTKAVRDGEDWIINGEKFFTSNAKNASFLIVMAVTEPDAAPRESMSMFLVPTDTPGIELVRETGVIGDPLGVGLHPHVRYTDVRVGPDALLGERGKGFYLAQARLAGGRLHHAMRTIGLIKRAFDMQCERALSRKTFRGTLADNAIVKAGIADSWIQIEQFRLLVLYAAWQIDTHGHIAAMEYVSACKVEMARVVHDVVERSLHLHGALGASNETPLARLWQLVPTFGLMDGPTEVHQDVIARRVLRHHSAAEGDWPTQFLPDLTAAARARYGIDVIE
ncbi:MAG: acyl-CoA dehydrogenase family protein [Nocardiaceae bacterium]|nr:acyl-CoA dehydrogenase family protein [Nocardiaceae bacterium]